MNIGTYSGSKRYHWLNKLGYVLLIIVYFKKFNTFYNKVWSESFETNFYFQTLGDSTKHYIVQ